jgi:hypothetical protein
VDDALAIFLALASVSTLFLTSPIPPSQPELDVRALTITFGNTLAPSAYQNTLKLFACLAREFAQNPQAMQRYACNLSSEKEDGNGGKIVLALGAEGPVGGERDLAAYFVSTFSSFTSFADRRIPQSLNL